MRPLELDGIVPVIPTPFARGGALDLEQLAGLVEFAIAAGASAICLPAYASEYYKLSETERLRVAACAVESARGRTPVIGQANNYSAAAAAEHAVRLEELGASAICTAVPRLFPLDEDDLARHFEVLLGAMSSTLVIQDFNPGGPSLSAPFIARLHRAFPHFRYVKLEEPRMASKVRQIRDATGGGVGVIEGWGGMYIMELVEEGAAAVMPGLALADLLNVVFRRLQRGSKREAFAIFQRVLPQIVYSLQSMEFFHHAEKRLLAARGVLRDPEVRETTVALQASETAHIEFLNTEVLALLDQLDMPRNPAAARAARP